MGSPVRRALAGLTLALAAACASRPAAAPEPPGATVVVVSEPEEPPVVVEQAAPAEAPPDAGALELPPAWSEVVVHDRPYAEAVGRATLLRRAVDAALAGSSADAGAPTPREFERLNALVDQASRSFAAAYYAPDASQEGKVDALRAAAEMDLAWARRLDEVGLAKTPSSWRSDVTVPLTFEDVAAGPARRWRDEALALVSLCVELSRDVATDSARACAGLSRTYGRVAVRRPSRGVASAKDAGSPSGCACSPGDPLCSASMNGWCKPR